MWLQAASKSTERLATENVAVILVAYHAGGKGLTLVQGMSCKEVPLLLHNVLLKSLRSNGLHCRQHCGYQFSQICWTLVLMVASTNEDTLS